MKIKTTELQREALDRMVAKAICLKSRMLLTQERLTPATHTIYFNRLFMNLRRISGTLELPIRLERERIATCALSVTSESFEDAGLQYVLVCRNW
jgi:hypothetical protein